MGEFNSDDHYIYYCGQESLRRNGVAIMVNKNCHCFLLIREVTDVNPQSQRGDIDATTYSTEECQDI